VKLDDIVKQFLNIAIDIENGVMFDKSLEAQRKHTAANLISSKVQPLSRCVMDNSTPSRSKIKQALRDLDEISKTYQIEELKKPIKDLKTYLNNLG